MENFGLGGDSKKKERCYGYVEIRRTGPCRRAHCGLGDRPSIGDAGERAGNGGRRHQWRTGCPLRGRALSLLVEAGRLLPTDPATTTIMSGRGIGTGTDATGDKR